ncbi:hypothetical protein ACFL13_02005 [Patescibacteria group bacterium]
MLKKYLIPILLLTFFIFPVFSKNSPDNPSRNNGQENKPDTTQKRSEAMEAKCERFRMRIQERAGSFSASKDAHVNNYNKVIERLEAAATALEDKGLDASKLVEDLEAFAAMVVDYSENYFAFVELLKEAQGTECGEFSGEGFKSKMAEARQQWRGTKGKRAEIREFYKSVIREDIKDLREQARDLNLQEGDTNE